MAEMSEMTGPQREQCRRYLRELRQCGGFLEAAERAGVKRTTINQRRRRFPAFEHACQAARVYALARIAKGEARAMASPDEEAPLRSKGGEYTVARGKDGRAQVRRMRAGELTPAGRRAVLAGVAATCNIRLAAEAVGYHPSGVHYRMKKDGPFGHAMTEALEDGRMQVELALMEHALHLIDEIECGDAAAEPGEWRDPAADARAAPLIGQMTLQTGMMVMGQHAHHGPSRIPRRNFRESRPTPEETDRMLTRAMDALAWQWKRQKEKGSE